MAPGSQAVRYSSLSPREIRPITRVQISMSSAIPASQNALSTKGNTGPARGRPSNQVNNNHHRQRWTPADIDRRRFPGQICPSHDSRHLYLASGRRGQRPGQGVRFWEQDGSGHRRAGAPKRGDRSHMKPRDQPRRLPLDRPLARALYCGPGRREFEPLTGPTRACRLLYSSEIQQPRRATAILGTHQHTCWAAPFECEQGRASSYGSKGWGSSPSERARVLAGQRHLSSLSRGSRRSAGAFLVLFVTRPFRTCRRRRSARRAPGRATPAARRPHATPCGRSRRPCDCHAVWYVIVL